MEFYFATENDVDLLAQWNHQLIHDEGYVNPMTVPELSERMSRWLAREYKAVIFTEDSNPVAYGLYRENEAEVYLRQFFVRRDRRRHGFGRQAILLFRQCIWSRQKRLSVEVLCSNAAGIEFWRAMGYQDYSLELEIRPNSVEVANALYRLDKSGERAWNSSDADL